MAKKWGQHFLIKGKYAQKLLKLAGITSDDFVLEIGSGRGFLTTLLIQVASQMVCVEIDPKLCQLLHQKYDKHQHWRLIESDVLDLQEEQWERLFEAPYKIVANLPYQISSPLFFRLFEMRHLFQSVTLMVQKEWAKRVCATVQEGKNYGALSVIADFGFVRRYASEVPPTAFLPPPRVDSALINLVPKPYLQNPLVEKEFATWVKTLFEYRRKTLFNSFKFASIPPPIIEELAKKYDFKRRVETFSSIELWDLFQNYKSIHTS